MLKAANMIFVAFSHTERAQRSLFFRSCQLTCHHPFPGSIFFGALLAPMAAWMAIFLPVSTPDWSTSTNGLRELSTGLTAIQVVFFQIVTDLFVHGFG